MWLRQLSTRLRWPGFVRRAPWQNWGSAPCSPNTIGHLVSDGYILVITRYLAWPLQVSL